MILFPYTLLFFVLIGISIAAPGPYSALGPDAVGKVFYANSRNWNPVRVVS